MRQEETSTSSFRAFLTEEKGVVLESLGAEEAITRIREVKKEMNELSKTISNLDRKIEKLWNEVSDIDISNIPEKTKTTLVKEVEDFRETLKEITRLKYQPTYYFLNSSLLVQEQKDREELKL